MFVRCWHMSLSSLSCHFTRVLVTSHDHTLRFLIFTVINPVNCERTVISLFHLFSRSDDHRCGPRWGLLTTECIVRDGVYTCTLGVQAVCTPVQSTWNVTYSLHRERRMSHGNKDSHNSTCGEKYLPSWHSWARICSPFLQTGSQPHWQWHTESCTLIIDMSWGHHRCMSGDGASVTTPHCLSVTACHQCRPVTTSVSSHQTPLLTCLQYWLAMECGPLTRNVLA